MRPNPDHATEIETSVGLSVDGEPFALWTAPTSVWAEYGPERAISLNSTDMVGGMGKAMVRAPEMSAAGPLIQAMASAGQCDCLRPPLVADLPGSVCFDV